MACSTTVEPFREDEEENSAMISLDWDIRKACCLAQALWLNVNDTENVVAEVKNCDVVQALQVRSKLVHLGLACTACIRGQQAAGHPS